MNENRKNYIEGEINALKSLLRNSDYQLMKLVENLTDCTNITGLVACFKAFLEGFGELVKSRRAWRASINTLEAELEEITAAETPVDGELEHADAVPADDTDEADSPADKTDSHNDDADGHSDSSVE